MEEIKKEIWMYNFQLLMCAHELSIPVVVFCKTEKLEGYITGVNVIRSMFMIEIPGVSEREVEIVQDYKFKIQYLPNVQIKTGQKVRIWVDDIREVPAGYIGTKSVNETIALIEEVEKKEGEIEFLDLDHDLGDYAKYGGDAIKILDYLAGRETYYPIKIHTANPVGRANMQRMIERYWP